MRHNVYPSIYKTQHVGSLFTPFAKLDVFLLRLMMVGFSVHLDNSPLSLGFGWSLPLHRFTIDTSNGIVSHCHRIMKQIHPDGFFGHTKSVSIRLLGNFG